ncbi:hypothetical protein OBBRIDRAFT_836294 [Obba rivulosa]|uniref:Uncharacterized protein n=1 Tax=Obba rivulosa TaxID=1052685 RepID=A0A8E2DI01_9APHY|nr:hypothetical protein OBBRIDRAFT_836294 [Obba rivulosa]
MPGLVVSAPDHDDWVPWERRLRVDNEGTVYSDGEQGHADSGFFDHTVRVIEPNPTAPMDPNGDVPSTILFLSPFGIQHQLPAERGAPYSYPEGSYPPTPTPTLQSQNILDVDSLRRRSHWQDSGSTTDVDSPRSSASPINMQDSRDVLTREASFQETYASQVRPLPQVPRGRSGHSSVSVGRWRSSVAVSDFPRVSVASAREDEPAAPPTPVFTREPARAAPPALVFAREPARAASPAPVFAREPARAASPAPVFAREPARAASPAHATLPVPSAYMGPDVPPGMALYYPQPVPSMLPLGYSDFPGHLYPQPRGYFYPQVFPHHYAQFPGPMWPQFPGNTFPFTSMPPYPGSWYAPPFVVAPRPHVKLPYAGTR